jgi:hypothetical protein
MPSSLPTPADCCSTCTTPVNVNVPGVNGAAGAAGSNGTNGLNAFCTINGATLIPAIGNQVTLALNAPGSQWMGVDQIIYLATYGYYQVNVIPDALSVTLTNLNYTGNVAGNGMRILPECNRVESKDQPEHRQEARSL